MSVRFMAEWLTLIGIGEDGLAGLSEASRAALARAEVVFGGPRHLALIEHADKRDWPVPFSLAPLLALRGQAQVAALVSGDPFWHGAGGTLGQHLAPREWRSFPAPSVFSLAASRLGWRLEEVTCLGLHAAPLATLRRHLHAGQRLIVTLRDGAAPADLGRYLSDMGFGASKLWVLERLGGPAECVTPKLASDSIATTAAPVACAIEVAGEASIGLATGREDALFAHDGQITKRPIRALALSALAPRAGEVLWDLGSGSGSVAIEWLLTHPANRAFGVERDPARAERARRNAAEFGLGGFTVIEGDSLSRLHDLPPPDAVFVGGGLGAELLEALWPRLPIGCRLVAHGVTLETEGLLAFAHAQYGGQLLRLELAEAAPLGTKRGWKSSYPVVQWRVVR